MNRKYGYIPKNKGVPNCQLCGEEWFDKVNDNLVEDYESIDENKRCIGCYQEWGDNWPDRV